MSPASLPLIPEILRLICEEIDDKSTLASLARTCAAFENPALDTLWLNIRGLYPLTQCLPSDLWMEVQREVDRDQVTYIVLKDALIQQSCTRLIKNAKRIHNYEFQTYYKAKYVDVTVYEALQFAMYGMKLLPNIRSLTFTSSDYEPFNFSFIHMFLGPHLTSVEISGHPTNFTPQLSLLSTLFNIYPSLKHVRFSSRRYLPDAPNEVQETRHISSFVYQWRNLESLKVSNLTFAALEKVSLLPNLKTLELCSWKPYTVLPRIDRGRGGFRAFPSLRQLHTLESKLDDLNSGYVDETELIRKETWSRVQELLHKFLPIKPEDTVDQILMHNITLYRMMKGTD